MILDPSGNPYFWTDTNIYPVSVSEGCETCQVRYLPSNTFLTRRARSDLTIGFIKNPLIPINSAVSGEIFAVAGTEDDLNHPEIGLMDDGPNRTAGQFRHGISKIVGSKLIDRVDRSVGPDGKVAVLEVARSIPAVGTHPFLGQPDGSHEVFEGLIF